MLNLESLVEECLYSHISNENINIFNYHLINKIDDIYFMSRYITFLHFYTGGGLLELDLIDKLVCQNKYKNVKIFIIDDVYYNFKKKIILERKINKYKNITCKIFPNIKDFLDFITEQIIKIDFIIGTNNFYQKLKEEDVCNWKIFIRKIVGNYGINDKDMFLANETGNKFVIKKLSLYNLK